MWKYLIIFFLANTESFRVESCGGDSKCIPLSECQKVKEMLEGDVFLDCARNLVCGYFHEPYVCCNRNCNTPNGNYGKSVPLDECPHLKVNQKSYDQRKKKFLEESYLNKTHVCCNEGENSYIPVPPVPIGAFNPSTRPLKPSNSSCVTPNGEKAKCVHINNCKAYQEVAREVNSKFQFINDSFCGYWKEPMICCGEASQYHKNYKENLPREACGVWDEKINPIPPWLVLIKSSCIGAVINQKYVLGTVSCVGENSKKMDVRIGKCINDWIRDDCKYEVDEIKTFPLHQYLRTEDTGIVLLKLNRPIERQDFMPVCLPNIDLAYDQEIEIIGLEKFGITWRGTKIETRTLNNDLCYNTLRNYFERIVCIQGEVCESKKNLLQNFLLINEEKWRLVGLFNKEGCYGFDNKYSNSIYVYKFLPWIFSNIN